MPKRERAPHQSKRRTWKDRLASGAVRLASRLPLDLLQRLGSGLGHLFVAWPNKQRRNALINIRLCYPHLTPQEQVTLRDHTLRAFGATYLEIAYLWQRPAEVVLSLVTDVRGGALLERRGAGVIVLSPHLGAWELAGLYLAAQGPTTIFYKPQRLLDDLIRAARGRTGATLAPTSPRGVRLLVQALERGEYAGILPDQEPKGDTGAVFAPFFGVPAYTMLLVNRLARRTGARVIFMFAERLGPGRGFRIHCIAAPEGVDAEDDPIAAAALNLGVERCVAVCPEQYVWPYKRFRRRPEGPPSPYRGPL
jgi:Kdo2-lipid IVA lauroyltransferase/acyltransferase